VKETEERDGTSSALLFGQLDFRVTRVMILVAAARSRIANIEPRHSDVLTEKERRSDRFENENEERERERFREMRRRKNREKGEARFISHVLNLSIYNKSRLHE